MVRAIDIDETRQYVVKADRELPAEEQTSFLLGVIDSITMGKLEKMDVEFNAETNDTKIQANVLGRDIEIVRHGVKGWENFKDGKGQPVVCEISTVGRVGGSSKELNDASLRRIPVDVIKELAEVIRNQNVVGEAEGKN